MEQKTIEGQVAQSVLQRTEEIIIGERTFQFHQPSIATLILASEAISQLPKLQLTEERLAEDSLRAARDCRILGDVVAILLLGAKNLTEKVREPQKTRKRILFGLFSAERTIEVERTIDRKGELARQLIEDLTPTELHTLTAKLLQRMQLADFFGLTTFLNEVNLTRPTKVGKTTASGL